MGVRCLLLRFISLGVLGFTSVGMMTGCAWHGHKKKSNSYNRNVSEEENDPTYRDDPQRAGEEIKYVQ